GLVGGVTGAAITAIVMIFEMTLDYNVILPMTITVAISYGVRKFLCKESIYTLKLARRGHHMPESMQSSFHLVRLARDLMQNELVTVPASASVGSLATTISNMDHNHYLVVEKGGRLFGLVERNPAVQFLAQHPNGTTIGDIAQTQYEVVSEQTTVFELLTKLRSSPITFFLVAAPAAEVLARDIKGVISKERITDLMTESLGLFAE
ncbi:MAG: CBS domain-containing protein, partial [Limisphaerales bacterium]